jgi:hypothetical protein
MLADKNGVALCEFDGKAICKKVIVRKVKLLKPLSFVNLFGIVTANDCQYNNGYGKKQVHKSLK